PLNAVAGFADRERLTRVGLVDAIQHPHLYCTVPTHASASDDVKQFSEPRLIGIPLVQDVAQLAHHLNVVTPSFKEVDDLLLRMLLRQQKLQTHMTVDVVDELRVLAEERNRIGGWRLECPAGDEIEMIEERAINDRAEQPVAHPSDHLI